MSVVPTLQIAARADSGSAYVSTGLLLCADAVSCWYCLRRCGVHCGCRLFVLIYSSVLLCVCILYYATHPTAHRRLSYVTALTTSSGILDTHLAAVKMMPIEEVVVVDLNNGQIIGGEVSIKHIDNITHAYVVAYFLIATHHMRA